jgi:predicted O-linked N-acetylglucosamine transferase (SPINDLY family)
MAANRTELLALRRSLRQRLLARPAWDIERYSADFSALLRALWRDACA